MGLAVSTALPYSSYLCEAQGAVVTARVAVITVLLRCVVWCLWLLKHFGLQLEPILAKPGVFADWECGPAWPSFRGH